MSKNYSDRTIAYYAELPLTRFINGGETKVAPVANKSQVMKKQCDEDDAEVHPEHEAVSFYTMNHLVADIASRYHRHEPLPDMAVKILRAYHSNLSWSAARAFHYLLLICIRESRHSHWNNNSYVECAQKFGKNTAKFVKENGGEDGIMNAFFNNPPDTTLGNLCRALSWIFYNTGFSSAYGGPKWGNVADCLSRYVDGVYSAEMMLDTNWTLVHNGGPIFNKGYLYHTHQSTAGLTRILDCQRAGVMPTAIFTDQQVGQWAHSWVKVLTDQWNTHLGGTLVEAKVDWNKVVQLGAVGNYPEATVAKVKNHSAPFSTPKPIIMPKPGMMEFTSEVLSYNSKTHYQVMAGILVPKTPRPKKA